MGQLATWTDQALLESALSGSEAAWVTLVERYNPMGMRYVRRHIDDPHLAQDILQNLWIALVGAVKRQAPDQFAALFWTLLKRRLIDELRRKGRSKEAATLDSPLRGDESEGSSLLERQASQDPDPQEATVRSEEQQLVYRALDQLPDHYRLVIVSRQLEGRSNKETARRLVDEGLVTDDGNVEKRVENYYYRGLKELKRQLEALGFNGGGGAAW
ncbi:MAG TPA: sigma-70 family RNA polymerase sigma factor [Symbiobacteriaceae bacterium]|nr:sigma-70 family RNA polymerase sigma factor [Symbiobacteriaceae bacterium]